MDPRSIAIIQAKNFIASLVLGAILSGAITSPDQLPFKVNNKELQELAGTIELENGCNSVRVCLYTGSVVLNRKDSDKWNGSTIEEVILARDGGYLQYAEKTRNGFKTVKCSSKSLLCAKYLLIFGSVLPENVVYQGQNPKAGSGIYYPKKGDPNEGEYFCYE